MEKGVISKLTDTDGEIGETILWLDFALDFKYITLTTEYWLLIKKAPPEGTLFFEPAIRLFSGGNIFQHLEGK